MGVRTRTREERFWEKVDEGAPDECWEWTARRHKQGYGLLSEWDGSRRSRLLAHRVSWEIANGPIPAGLCVLHRCDNPPCVNPRHLFLGTQVDNNLDRHLKGRTACGENAPRARLSAEDVREIRRRCSAGESRQAVGKEFGICHRHVGSIVRRELWRSVT